MKVYTGQTLYHNDSDSDNRFTIVNTYGDYFVAKSQDISSLEWLFDSTGKAIASKNSSIVPTFSVVEKLQYKFRIVYKDGSVDDRWHDHGHLYPDGWDDRIVGVLVRHGEDDEANVSFHSIEDARKKFC